MAGALLAGLLLLWVVLVTIFYVAGRGQGRSAMLREVLRLIPDVVRLLRRLAADPTVPRSVRLILAAVLVYLLSPIDLVPDFVPVAGYADDALVVLLALRIVTRRAGVEAVERHWPGTDDGLVALKRLAGLRG